MNKSKKNTDKKQVKKTKPKTNVRPGNQGRTKRYDEDGNYIKYTGRLLKGIGICDIPAVDGRGKHTKSYSVWASFIGRCTGSHNNKQVLTRSPTYDGVLLDPRWVKYSGYKKFHDAKYVEGYALDKDLRVFGNKTYGPDTCAFVPRYINNLLIDRRNHRGKYPLGVTYIKRQNSFAVQMSKYGNSKVTKYFKDPETASRFYLRAKAKHIRTVAYWSYELGHIDEDVYHGLVMHAKRLRDQTKRK